MANYRLTDKTVLANNPASDDVLMVVDVSDLSSSAQGTSKQYVAEYMVATEKVSIINSQFVSLSSVGVKLVQSKGTNKVIIPISVYCEYTEGTTAQTNTVNATIGHIDQSATYFWDQSKNFSKSPSNNGISWVFNGGSPSGSGASALVNLDDLPLYFYFLAGVSKNATGTIDIWTTYRLIDIS